jgi:type IV pilus assembly protein PilO
MALDERQQKLVFVGVLFAMAAGMYWHLIYKVKAKELADKNAAVDSMVVRTTAIQTLNRGGNLRALREESARYREEMTVMRPLVPAQSEVPALLDNITSAARSAGLDVSGVTPEGVLVGDQFDIHKFNIRATGQYHRVAGFLANIASLERIVAPINVILTPGPPAVGDRKPRRNETFVSAVFGIMTYVAKIPAPPPPAPPPPPAAPPPATKHGGN